MISFLFFFCFSLNFIDKLLRCFLFSLLDVHDVQFYSMIYVFIHIFPLSLKLWYTWSDRIAHKGKRIRWKVDRHEERVWALYPRTVWQNVQISQSTNDNEVECVYCWALNTTNFETSWWGLQMNRIREKKVDRGSQYVFLAAPAYTIISVMGWTDILDRWGISRNVCLQSKELANSSPILVYCSHWITLKPMSSWYLLDSSFRSPRVYRSLS